MNKYKAIAKYISYSPYKLRPLVDVIRGKNAEYALGWLNIYRNQRSIPIIKVLESALANAKYKGCDAALLDMVISEIKVDQGPIKKYFKPGAQGRATILRKRYCHIEVVVQAKELVSGAIKNNQE